MAPVDVDDNRVVCTFVVCCPIERYIVFVYSNSLVQLFDTTRKEVFARMWIPATKTDPVVKVYPLHECVLMRTRNKKLFSLCVRHRVLMTNDVMNDSMLNSVRLAP